MRGEHLCAALNQRPGRARGEDRETRGRRGGSVDARSAISDGALGRPEDDIDNHFPQLASFRVAERRGDVRTRRAAKMRFFIRIDKIGPGRLFEGLFGSILAPFGLKTRLRENVVNLSSESTAAEKCWHAPLTWPSFGWHFYFCFQIVIFRPAGGSSVAPLGGPRFWLPGYLGIGEPWYPGTRYSGTQVFGRPNQATSKNGNQPFRLTWRTG